MQRIIFLCFLANIFSAIAYSQILPPQETMMITGRILDTLRRSPIEDVIVVNKTSNKTVLSESDGYYYINASMHDTLIFYMVGYYPKFVTLHTKEIFHKQVQLVLLKQNMEELKQVDITGERIKEKMDKLPFNQTPASVGSPITFLYEMYSKKYKQYRKVETLENAKRERQLRERKLTKVFVMNVTGLNEKGAEEFIKRINFSNEWIQNATEYELIIAVKKKYKEFSLKR